MYQSRLLIKIIRRARVVWRSRRNEDPRLVRRCGALLRWSCGFVYRIRRQNVTCR
jgi:hypothetical protein